ncbi:protein-disulfide reductase DsbD [Brevundimonas sp. Leaf363]|uniref:protein-disulfide reductase DsbD family protein n=1 Tax=Brevundimonas sp. Leaf363 TaxID=1736353 RepID=UPI0009E828F3|nr:thioredoxin family protein [Brevundimonas sp. Leaf363]
MTLLRIGLLALLLALFGHTAQAAPQKTERIEAELVPMSAWAAPGSTAIVAVRQKIAPGWHTYWRNPGDSGGPTSLSWTLPSGVTAGDILWPTPGRQRLMSLVNYGYEGEVFLPVPIQIPATARPGQTLPLTVEALFLVCSDQLCVPEPLTLTAEMPIRAGAAPLSRPYGLRIEQTVEIAPRPAGLEARMTAQNGRILLSVSGAALTAAKPTQAWFYPFDAGRIDHAAAQSGTVGPDGLRLTLTPAARQRGDGPLAGIVATDAGAWEISATPGAPLPGTDGRALQPLDGAPAAPASTGLVALAQAALFAFLGGLILNLMPCVFPILAMKAAALAASAGDRAAARRDGLAFSAGALVTFLALAGVLIALRAAGQAVGWGFQLQSPAVTAGLSLLLLASALNLSGVFHVGRGLQGVGSGPLSRLPGAAGAAFTGVLAVVVASPCTAPFMAPAMGAALVMAWPLALLVFLFLGLGFVLPYLAVSLWPAALSRLRPGAWMERLKGLLAFPLYGAALWLAWVFARQAGDDALAALMASGLLLALSLWLAGRAQDARARGRPYLWHSLFAALSLVLAGAALIHGLRAPGPAEPSAQAVEGRAWSPEAVASAQAEGRTVLVNFTADWCVTCKINEGAALSSPAVRRALDGSNAVYLVGDWTRRDPAIAAELSRHGRSGVPLYLVYRPGQARPEVLPQLLTEGVVLEALK